MDSTDKDPEIVLAEAEGSFWLVNGEDHLDVMLEGPTGYPLPVGIIIFSSQAAMAQNFGPELPVTALWQVNPKVVARLRADNQVIELVAG